MDQVKLANRHKSVLERPKNLIPENKCQLPEAKMFFDKFAALIFVFLKQLGNNVIFFKVLIKFFVEKRPFFIADVSKKQIQWKSKINAQSHHFLVFTRYRAAPSFGIKKLEKKLVAQYCTLNALDYLLFSKFEFKEIYESLLPIIYKRGILRIF